MSDLRDEAHGIINVTHSFCALGMENLKKIKI
jgi:hypothetical protein